MIELRTLGQLRLKSRDGTPLQGIVGREKRLALLVYLAVAEPPGPHRRDTLAALFWPESPPERARTALRQALKILRGALGRAAVTSVGDAVGVAPDQVACDAADFAGAIRAG